MKRIMNVLEKENENLRVARTIASFGRGISAALDEHEKAMHGGRRCLKLRTMAIGIVIGYVGIGGDGLFEYVDDSVKVSIAVKATIDLGQDPEEVLFNDMTEEEL